MDPATSAPPLPQRAHVVIALTSAALLIYEVAITRLFSAARQKATAFFARESK